MLEGYKQLLYFHFAGLFYQKLVIKYMYIIYYIIHGQMSQVHFSFVWIHAWFSPHCNQQKSGYIGNKAFLSSRSKCLCHVISIWLLLFLGLRRERSLNTSDHPRIFKKHSNRHIGITYVGQILGWLGVFNRFWKVVFTVSIKQSSITQIALQRWANVGPTSAVGSGRRWLTTLAQRWPCHLAPPLSRRRNATSLPQRWANVRPTSCWSE